MSKEISSKSLSAHDELLSDVELCIFGLQMLGSIEVDEGKESDLWFALYCHFVDLLVQYSHDLRTWDNAVRKGHDFGVDDE